MTPPSLIGGHNLSTSRSVAACIQSKETSSKSHGGMSICNQPHKQRLGNVGLGCSRSNVAMILLNSDDLVVSFLMPIVDTSIPSSVVIALSSKK